MEPNFVIFLKEDKPYQLNGKTMVYNLSSTQGRHAFMSARYTLLKKHPQLIFVAKVKGVYRIQVKEMTSGYIRTIKCEKFPSVCIPTACFQEIGERTPAENFSV